MRWVKQNYPQVDVIGGNIATGALRWHWWRRALTRVKVGIGPGSICTTRIVAGVVFRRSWPSTASPRRSRAQGCPLIADGGIRFR